MLLRFVAQDVAHQVRFAAVIHLGELLRDGLGDDAFFFHSVLSYLVDSQLDPVAAIHGDRVTIPLAAGGFDGVVEVDYLVQREQVRQVGGADQL